MASPLEFSPYEFNKKYYMGVEGRLGVDFAMLELPLTTEETLQALDRMHCTAKVRDIVSIARERMGETLYKRGASQEEWPGFLDCSSMVKWLYGQVGIWLPRYSIDQSQAGRAVPLDALQPGDLLYSPGRLRSYYWDDPAQAIGHALMMASKESVIHMPNSKRHMVEESLEAYLKRRPVVAAVRIVEDFSKLYTIFLPTKSPIETTLDLRWKILQTLQQ